jgi:hypothetical protein
MFWNVESVPTGQQHAFDDILTQNYQPDCNQHHTDGQPAGVQWFVTWFRKLQQDGYQLDEMVDDICSRYVQRRHWCFEVKGYSEGRYHPELLSVVDSGTYRQRIIPDNHREFGCFADRVSCRVRCQATQFDRVL